MSFTTIGDRHKAYESVYDSTIIRRIPVIIRADGRSFSKVTRRIRRPYCNKMLNLMSLTMLETIKQMDGAVFGFQQSDEITFVLKNDQELETEPWFGNRIQKLCSITSSMVTYIFNEALSNMEDPPELIGQTIFDTRVFAVPDYSEAVNNLVFRQQDCIANAITGAAYAELGRQFGKKTAYRLLHGKSLEERQGLLKDECGIDFTAHYPLSFRHGVGAYRAPHVLEVEAGQITKQKWILDFELPKFTDSREFIMGIITTGGDVFRRERDL